MSEHSVTTWLGLLRDGDHQAAQPLWERYFASLVEIARGRLNGTSRAVADEEDVAISAFQSFCHAAADGRFPRLTDRSDLWQILVMLTARKAHQERRKQWTAKRGGHDTPDGRRTAPPEPLNEIVLDDIVGNEPDPAFASQIAENFDRLIARLPDDLLRRLARLRLEGHTVPEIAQRENVSVRTIERKIALIRGFWEESAES